MALPVYKGSGAFVGGAGAITPAMPTGGAAPAADDILLLVCESENEAISLSTANGFVEVGDQANKAAGTAATHPASRLAVYWKRAVGSDASPTVADSGDHNTARIHCFSGCITTGDPWDVFAEDNDGGASDTSGSIPGATTTVDDCLVVLLCSTSANTSSTVQFSGWTNADLANLAEQTDNSSTAGFGGGHGMATGEKASAGAYGATAVTLTANFNKGQMSIALKPPAGGAQVFGAASLELTDTIGSAAKKDAHGASAVPLASTLAAAGKKNAHGASAVPLSASIAASGKKNAVGATAVPVVFTIDTDGVVTTPAIEGAASLELSFGASSAARKNAKGAAELPAVLSIAAQATRNAHGAAELALSVSVSTAGARDAHGASALPLVVSVATAGKKNARASFALPLTFDFDVAGQVGGTVAGSASLELGFGASTAGKKEAYASAALPATFSVATQGGITRHGALALALVFSVEAAGQRRAYGALALPLVVGIDTAGDVGGGRSRAYAGSGRTGYPAGSTRSRATPGLGR